MVIAKHVIAGGNVRRVSVGSVVKWASAEARDLKPDDLGEVCT